jgi:hypothetical protein
MNERLDNGIEFTFEVITAQFQGQDSPHISIFQE